MVDIFQTFISGKLIGVGKVLRYYFFFFFWFEVIQTCTSLLNTHNPTNSICKPCKFKGKKKVNIVTSINQSFKNRRMKDRIPHNYRKQDHCGKKKI